MLWRKNNESISVSIGFWYTSLSLCHFVSKKKKRKLKLTGDPIRLPGTVFPHNIFIKEKIDWIKDLCCVRVCACVHAVQCLVQVSCLRVSRQSQLGAIKLHLDFCRWCDSVSHKCPWLHSACTGQLCSHMWSSWIEMIHVQLTKVVALQHNNPCSIWDDTSGWLIWGNQGGKWD